MRLRAGKHDFEIDYSPPGLCNVAAGLAAAAVVAGTVKGVKGAQAAKRAGNLQQQAGQTAAANQLQAAQQANQVQWNMNQATQQLQSPFIQQGQQAMAALSGGLFGAPQQQGQYPSYGGNQNNGGYATNGPADPINQRRFAQNVGGNGPTNNPAVNNGIGAAAGQYGGQGGINGAPAGPNMQAQGVGGGTTGAPGTAQDTSNMSPADRMQAGFNNLYAGSNMDPNQTSIGSINNYGATPQQTAQAGNAFSGQLGAQFSNQDLANQINPAYNFMFDQGLRALKNSLAGSGKLGSGQGMRDIQNYAQQYALNQGYQPAFNNYMTQKNYLTNTLMGMGQLGQGAANTASQANMQTGANIAGTGMQGAQIANDYATGAAASKAAGLVGSSNQLWGGIQGGIKDAANIYFGNIGGTKKPGG